MATVSSVVIRPEGWSADVTVTGWAGQAGNVTYDYSGFSVLVTSEGYNASGVLGTVTRTVNATTTVRKPYPNEAQLDETDSGGDLVIRIAFDENIYDDDKNGGVGTSGVDPVVTIGAGWAEITADPTVAFNANATNNSTLDYPKVIGQWDWETTPALSRVESGFDIGFNAKHGFSVAVVALSAVGVSSLHAVSANVTAKTVTSHSASGLSSESYKLSVPSLTSYTQGENITLKAIAYPAVGDQDSIIDTSTSTGVDNWIKGNAEITCTCDKTGALKQYAVVDTLGNDGTGVVSAVLATAEATPFLTIGGAIGAGATVIYVNDGSFSVLGVEPVAPANLDYWREVRQHPSATAVTLNRGGGRKYRANKLAYIGMTINGTDFMDGEADDRVNSFQACSMNNAGGITTGLGYRSKGTWQTGCAYTGGTDQDEFEQFSSVSMMYAFTGGSYTINFSADVFSCVVGCKFDGQAVTDNIKINSNSGGAANFFNNKIVEHNYLANIRTNTAIPLKIADVNDVDDWSVIGNIIETSQITVTQPNIWISADGSTTKVNNLILAHNTIAGNRCNLFYNDFGAVASLISNVFVRSNSFQSYNIKSDTFASAPDGNRVGNWAQMNGVSYSDNRYDGSASPAFSNDYDGLNISYVTANNAVFGEMQYVDEQSSDVGGAGNGDYTPDTGSPLTNQTLTNPYLSYDLYGTALGSEIGAVFIAAAPPSGGGMTAAMISGMVNGMVTKTIN